MSCTMCTCRKNKCLIFWDFNALIIFLDTSVTIFLSDFLWYNWIIPWSCDFKHHRMWIIQAFVFWGSFDNDVQYLEGLGMSWGVLNFNELQLFCGMLWGVLKIKLVNWRHLWTTLLPKIAQKLQQRRRTVSKFNHKKLSTLK